MHNLEIAIMLEGQMGLNWTRWQRIARAVEDLGFAGLYRSDHFTNPTGPMQDSLDLWVSLVWLADNTDRIEFGPLVSPVSFRHPAHLVRYAAAIDELSGGRFTFGLGAGWQDREHESYSFDLLDLPGRFRRFEEALTVITGFLRRDEPVTFEGEFYQFKDAELKPRPPSGRPPILIGGNGPKLTLPLVARFADEWNAVYLTPETYRERLTQLEPLLAQQGRTLSDLRRSLMTGLVFGRTDAEVREKLASQGNKTPDDVRQRGIVVGTASEIVDQLGVLADMSIQRVMLQWFDLDDLDGLAALAQAVL